ncbi:hypothetical protein niasHS_010464 [Heterodera schachtii]|uniref:Uncharacterized protein n=1 Tax=Heterodera schachtii TaxID=97005 RepID=A0ABD2J5B3_HETSC
MGPHRNHRDSILWHSNHWDSINQNSNRQDLSHQHSITFTQPTNIPIIGTQSTSILELNCPSFQLPRFNLSSVSITGTQAHQFFSMASQSPGLNSPTFQSPGFISPSFLLLGPILRHYNYWDSILHHSNSRDSISPASQSLGHSSTQFSGIPITWTQFHGFIEMANQINFDQMTLKRNVEGSVGQQWTNATEPWLQRGERIELLERQMREIGDDLHMLKPPIDELFLDVDTLRQHRHADAADFNKQPIYNHFNVTNIPTLILLRQNMSVITSEGRNDLEGNLDDLVSRLTRGIGITNEKLDHLLTRIDSVDAAERGERIELLERQMREIGDDLHMLKPPIDELFLDVDTLRQHRHADAADFNKQVIGLEQRRTVYLYRLKDELMRRLGLSQGARDVTERYSTASSGTRGNAFCRVEDAIQWICDRMNKLNSETLEVLEQIFEQHKLDNRDIQDFRKTAEVSAVKMMESEYQQQLRELSAGRMVDLDALIAFIRAAQFELLWAHQREELKMTRNWSDLERLNIRMLQNYFKQLPHEIELHEKQFNDVHNQGTALINQRHPAGEVIEVYLSTMQNQWDWMLNLSKCMEGHLRDAYNAKAFVEESEQQMQQQLDHLDHEYSRTDFSLDDGEQMLRQLDFVREYIQQLHARLLSLTDRCAQISPLLQHGERISKPLPVMAFSEHKSKDKIYIRQGEKSFFCFSYLTVSKIFLFSKTYKK